MRTPAADWHGQRYRAPAMRIIIWNNSDSSLETVGPAARMLADRLGDSLQVVGHAHDEPEPASGADARFHGSNGAARNVTSALLADAPPAAAPPAAAQVLEACRAGAVRFVVVASAPGQSATAEPAGEIALHAPVPTLVLRDAAAIECWLQEGRMLRILLAHDLSRTADNALAALRPLLALGPCNLVVAHLHRPLEGHAPLGLCTDPIRDCEIEVQQIVERNLQERARRLLGDTPADTRVIPTPLRADFALLELARDERFDLVVVGTNQRQELDRALHPGSVSRSLLRSAVANVLLVPRAHARPDARTGIARVLVATDLMPSSNEAVAHGYGLLPGGGTLRLLHVVHPRALPRGEFDQAISRRVSLPRHMEVLRGAETQLRALALDPAEAPGVTTEFEVVEHAEPATAIAEAAERFGADVVCMASHRPDSVFGRLFKSRLQTVMDRTNRTLLIVHPSSP